MILIALFLTGFAPIIHKLMADGIEGLQSFPLYHTALTTLCYAVGTIFYISHFPESTVPDIFDIWVRKEFLKVHKKPNDI